MGVRRCAQVCASVRECARVCAGVHRCAQVCMDMYGCAQVCTGVRGYVWVWDVFSEFLLENRVPTSADFNTFPLRIFLFHVLPQAQFASLDTQNYHINTYFIISYCSIAPFFHF